MFAQLRPRSSLALRPQKMALRMLTDRWRVTDEEADYGIRETRQLLIDFVGGEPGAQLGKRRHGREAKERPDIGAPPAASLAGEFLQV